MVDLHVDPQDQRMLRAAHRAYSIKDNNVPVPKDDDYHLDIFVETPIGYTAGIDQIHAALLGKTSSEIVLAFRGTIPKDPWDVLNDADVPLVPFEGDGNVHQGFLRALTELWREIAQPLTALLDQNPGLPLTITGHSKGGSLALLAGVKIVRDLYDTVVTHGPLVIRTFAAPRVGDEVFRIALEKITANIRRYEYGNDIVPHVPLSNVVVTALDLIKDELPDWLRKLIDNIPEGYVSIGALQYIPHDPTEIEGDTPKVAGTRLWKLIHAALTSPEELISDHSSARDGGYALILDDDADAPAKT